MSRCRYPWTMIVALTLAIIFSFGSGRVFAASPHEQVLWSFGGPGDGSDPEAGLLQVGGKLYGTTRAGGANGAPGPLAGVVFQLTPPAPGEKAWGESVLWSFANFPYGNGVAGDGSEPIGGLISAGGKLYGTTFWGGASESGTAFQLTRPAPGQTAWTEAVLTELGNPTGGLLQFGGKLYTTYTVQGGGVSQLASGPDGWTATTIWSFPQMVSPEWSYASGLIQFGGTLFGVTDNGLAGSMYQLTPPAAGQTNWSENQLTELPDLNLGDVFPVANLLEMDGKLYGTTPYGGTGSCVNPPSSPSGCGTVYQLTPPAAGQTFWTEQVLWNFGGRGDGATPFAPLIAVGGKLYGTTASGGANTANNCNYTYNSGCGTVYQLTPPAPGQSAWTEQVLWNFGGPGDGVTPKAGLLAYNGALYGTTSGDSGTVFRVIP